MPKIKVDHIVTFTSEDSVHVAENILNSETTKKWKTKDQGESSANVILQLDRVTKICGVDICNECSAFVEVLVGRSSSPNEDYQPLIPMSSFMSPMESRELKETNRVRIFSHKDFIADIRDEKWDRVKFNCTQPFNKNIQYGLAHIALYSPPEDKKEETTAVSLGKFTLRPSSPDSLSAGSLFANRNEKKESLSELIKKMSSKEWPGKGSPRATNLKVQPASPSTSHATPKDKDKPSTSKNRNSIDLFYEAEDDETTEKIDRLIASRKQDELKKKASEDSPKNKNISSKKRNIDAVAKTPKKEVKQKQEEHKTKKPRMKKVTVKRPFNQLMNNVVFTISGIVNPERADLREKALELGAKYKPNWDNYCTHLICAFANTPKFKEVQGKGKIVTKHWIEDCHQQRKRLPWRRYALDRNDQGQSESEEEIFEQDENNLSEEEMPAQTENKSGSDTEDEIEKILAKQKEKEKKNGNAVNVDPFDADTDEEKFKQSNKPIAEKLPKIFDKEMFYVDDIFDPEEKQKLEKLITIVNGYVLDTPRIVVDYIVTREETAEDMKERYSDAKIVSRKWIYEMYNSRKLIPVDKYLLA